MDRKIGPTSMMKSVKGVDKFLHEGTTESTEFIAIHWKLAK